MTTSATEPWIDLILSARSADAAWSGIFNHLRDVALATPKPQALHKQTIDPDRLLAESAWSLWQDFPTHAPKVVDELKRFWTSGSTSGTAVLILDALSLREMPLIVSAAEKRGIVPTRVEVFGSEVPTETDQFAAALGVPARSKLYNNKPPGTFIFAGEDTYTDVVELPFEDSLSAVKQTPRIFLWHTWLDDLLHRYEDNTDGHSTIAREAKEQLDSDGFWNFIDRMRKGRRLVITGDHGYAVSHFFSDEVKDDDSIKLLRQHLHARRCARETPDNRWPDRHLPPLVIKHDGWLVVTGQRKWKVQGGFPHLCHRGLTLLEAAVPFIEIPPL